MIEASLILTPAQQTLHTPRADVARMQYGKAADPRPGLHPGYPTDRPALRKRGSADDAWFIHHRCWWMGKASSTLRSRR